MIVKLDEEPSTSLNPRHHQRPKRIVAGSGFQEVTVVKPGLITAFDGVKYSIKPYNPSQLVGSPHEQKITSISFSAPIGQKIWVKNES